MAEKNLDDFFRSSRNDKGRKPVKTKEKRSTYKPKHEREDSSFKEFFKKMFSFEYDVDLSDSASVLHRKNYVIRHIIQLVNLVFTLFSFIGMNKSNFVITIVFWLLMTALSLTIGYMLRRKQNDMQQQTIIMYLQSLFVFVLSVVLYIKIYLSYSWGDNEITSSEYAVSQAAYILIYFSIIITALYQDTTLLRNMFFWIFLIMMALNLTFLHPDLINHADGIREFFEYMFVTEKVVGIDIALRVIVLLLFYVLLFVISSSSSRVSRQRAHEFTKRAGIETNFKSVVQSVFEAVKAYSNTNDSLSLTLSARRSSEIAKVLAYEGFYLENDKIQALYDFAKIHQDKMNLLSMDEYNDINSNNIEEILEKTEVATKILRRLQILKKSEDIVLNIFNNNITEEFVRRMNNLNNDKYSQFILISDIYISLRTEKNYKAALTHRSAIEFMRNNIAPFVDKDILERFIWREQSIDKAYSV